MTAKGFCAVLDLAEHFYLKANEAALASIDAKESETIYRLTGECKAYSEAATQTQRIANQLMTEKLKQAEEFDQWTE